VLPGRERGVVSATRPGSLRFYRFARSVLRLVCFAPYRGRVIGAERVPSTGAFVFAPTHRSMLDIPWLSMATPRRVRFMGKASLFRVPVLGWVFSVLGGFPVERDGSDRGPLRDSLKILEGGEPLAIYPEGSRQRGHEIQPLQPGAAYLAIKAQVPIVPVAMFDTERAWRGPSKLPRFGGPGVVLVGDPIVPPPMTGTIVKRDLVNELSAQLRVELQQLYDEARLT
jgi:1-acyl-sn-glycerol-3-phosphate acyltransferase